MAARSLSFESLPTRFARETYDHFALHAHLKSLGISWRSATEPNRRCLFIELDRHQRAPGTMSGGVWRQSIAVCRLPGVRVGRDPHVILVSTADALQDVDESFGEDHAAETARRRPPRNSTTFALPERNVAISALDQ